MKTWEEYRTSLIKHGKECVLQNRLLVETRQKELEAWMQKAFAQFAHTISDKNFPCPFRQKSWAKGSTLFLFIKEPNDFSNLLRGMIEYTNFTKSTPIDNRILCPLVVFFLRHRTICKIRKIYQRMECTGMDSHSRPRKMA